ncbi:MAG TPA: glycoside hydrolase family 15 protein [Polyangia bacterium]|nr:glycoside hydrolase family 15 protein [Polyangia bacterium]
MRIEDYALLGDTQSAALVGKDGSIDWACFPRFDSGACFAALIGNRDNGRWRIAPDAPIRAIRRRYRPGTLILETEMETDTGVCRLIDFMPVRGHAPDIVRIVEGVRGTVPMKSDLVIRFDTGRVVPWVRRHHDAVVAIAGPDALCIRGDIEMHGENLATVSEFELKPAQRRAVVMTWFPSNEGLPKAVDPARALEETEQWWTGWSGQLTYDGPHREMVARSLMVLKALTYQPTGAIVAAPTTSLPEWPGSVRNWDYRYCWLRDATLTLYALMQAGYRHEARAWREWLLRAAAGDPSELQIMYGVAGERRLPEFEASWLAGYENSKPVHIGNAAHQQLQLDVYGELIEALYESRRFGIPPDRWAWAMEKALLESLEHKWCEPDEGIWEIRGERRHFTHSKVMAWVAFDRAVKTAEQVGLDGPVDKWRRIRDQIHAEVCARGFDSQRNTFTQSYGRPELDASLLMISLVGFLRCDDPRVAGTVRAVEQELLKDGFLLRYKTDPQHSPDGLPPGEGVFLPCSFWLADTYVQMGRRDEAERLFERLCGVANDLGLLSEEYDPVGRRLLGNFPQAFTHLALVNTAFNLSGHPASAAQQRKNGHGKAATAAT